MKPAWDKLGEAYADSTSVLIGDVDCTSDEGKPTCDANGVSGYPTIKYFTAETGKEGKGYEGGRDFDELDKFVKEELARKCDTKTLADCDDQQKAYITKQGAKAVEDLEKELARLGTLTGGDMKPDKRAWLGKRIVLLKDLIADKKGTKGEL